MTPTKTKKQIDRYDLGYNQAIIEFYTIIEFCQYEKDGKFICDSDSLNEEIEKLREKK